MAKTVAVVDEQTTGIQKFKSQPERLMSFLRDVQSEMRKVVYPSRAEVQSMTIIVVVTVFLFAGYFWLVDSVLGKGIEFVLDKLTTH